MVYAARCLHKRDQFGDLRNFFFFRFQFGGGRNTSEFRELNDRSHTLRGVKKIVENNSRRRRPSVRRTYHVSVI